MTRRVPEGPWDPTKIPRIQILMSQDVCLVGVGVVPFPQVERQSDELDESVDSSWTDRIGLITRRSEVQILPPPPMKAQERATPREWPFLLPPAESLPRTGVPIPPLERLDFADLDRTSARG
jgi:hypothetical protein